MRIITALVALAVGVAGCASGSPSTTPAAAQGSARPASTQPPATQPPATQSPATQSPTTQPTTQPIGYGSATTVPSGAGVLVEFGRQGGLAGVDERLAVQFNGVCSVVRRGRPARTVRLSQTDVAALRQQLDAANFPQLPPVNSNGGGVADGYTYRVVYRGREILAEDGAVPAPLAGVIGTLSQILSSTPN